MRTARLLAVLLACSAPASASAWATEKPARVREAVREEPVAEAREAQASLGPLLHASPERVRARMGDPDVSRAEGRGAFWTYRLEHCALFLFFHESPHGLQLTGAATGPRRRGEPALSVPACLAGRAQPTEP